MWIPLRVCAVLAGLSCATAASAQTMPPGVAVSAAEIEVFREKAVAGNLVDKLLLNRAS